MRKQFVFARVENDRLRVCYGDFRAECRGPDPNQVRSALAGLGLDPTDDRLARGLREAMDRFLFRERRAVAKFGKVRMFRIWRVDGTTVQVDFDGGCAELKGTAGGERALKQCLTDLGANDLLYPDLKRELRKFLKSERPEPLPNVLFFRDDGVLRVLVDDTSIRAVGGEDNGSLRRLAKRVADVDPDRFLATFHEYRSREGRIRRTMRQDGV